MKTYLKKYGRHPVVYWNENTKHTYDELSEMVNAILNDDVREYPNVSNVKDAKETKDTESSKDICFEWIKHA